MSVHFVQTLLVLVMIKRSWPCSLKAADTVAAYGSVLTVSCPAGRGDIQPQLNSAVQDVTDKYLLLEETEKQAVRKALIEERARFCIFVSMLRPVVVSSSVNHHCMNKWTFLFCSACQCYGSRFLTIFGHVVLLCVSG